MRAREKEKEKEREKERERERKREREKERKRERDKDRQTDRESARKRLKERERERERERESKKLLELAVPPCPHSMNEAAVYDLIGSIPRGCRPFSDQRDHWEQRRSTLPFALPRTFAAQLCVCVCLCE